MLEFLKKTANRAFTENGAAAYRTTESDCLDLFASIGAFRHRDDDAIIAAFQRAYAENADLAMKILFYSRDIRGGLGERRTFRIIINWLASDKPESVQKNLAHIAGFGRYDDLLSLLGTACEAETLDYIRRQFDIDMEALEKGKPVSLLGKWLPSVNASSRETVKNAKRIARAFGMNDAAYRKALSRLRASIRIIENNLREKDYSFDYAKQPSKAMFKYRQAFIRNDADRYQAFLQSVLCGKAELHTGTLMPYEIIAPVAVWNPPVLSQMQKNAMDASWRSLDDFTDGENAIAVVDGSGSMYSYHNPLPASVALSLGIYFAERNTGAFCNHFITFSERPRLVEIKGRDIVDKVKYCMRYSEIASTNIQKVFELILSAAVKNHVPQEQLPKTVYIISDMEFNACTSDAELTNFAYAKKLFASYGYQLPKVVFWNVAARNGHQPVTMNEQGVVLVSGCTPRIFSMAVKEKTTPYEFMMEVLNSRRYACIAA